ncbi:hypothetical protein LOOC260_119980 [Paucilactobacillus hokkaidonensis JCM 18461]|uniref:Integral membrane protein n=2 Tax=Paucilactobacillus hokkaidonensis TaxID=1193095 RepID=A0A0A1GZT1_9LACO|nr:hypothetical protein [Paucilactobacillus hokkaidonensis]KRO11133.1 hypothetical protein IV59_GL000885 [Paucilactobacillus hokkaidonensis]BAP86504.1 hypothetical protein LOOC260_119980 [Paucilactobacillus hokkaidonensis JCM 18461]
MKVAQKVISYSTISLVLYCVVNLLMYHKEGTALLSSEVINHLGIAIVLYLLVIIFSALNFRFSVYLTIFVLVIYTVALFGAFMEVNFHGKVDAIFRLSVDVLSVIGIVMNIMAGIAALRQRGQYISPKLRRK